MSENPDKAFIRCSPTYDAGYEAGWNGAGPDQNPERYSRPRRRWEEGRSEGAEAQMTYWRIREAKEAERRSFMASGAPRCQAPVPGGCFRSVHKKGKGGDRGRHYTGELCAGHDKRRQRGRPIDTPIQGVGMARTA